MIKEYSMKGYIKLPLNDLQRLTYDKRYYSIVCDILYMIYILYCNKKPLRKTQTFLRTFFRSEKEMAVT